MRRIPGMLMLAALLIFSAACGAKESAAPAEAAAVTETAAETAKPVLDRSAVPQLIAHAGGAIYGYRLTNSLEALDSAYAQGFRFIELDFSLSADGEPVLIHDWESMAARMLGREGCLSREDFLAAPSFAGLTLLDLDGLLRWLEEHPDCSVVTDVKCEDDTAVLGTIRERAGDLGDNFIPQIYDYGEYAPVSDLGFPRIILTLYRLPLEPDTLAQFAREYRPWGITVAQSRLTEELLAALKEASPDTAVFSHTVNDFYLFETWEPLGLTGIYTDYFVPEHWAYPAFP